VESATNAIAGKCLLRSDVFFEYFRYLGCALLRVSLLSALVVDVGDTETRRVAFGPLEVAAGTQLALDMFLWRRV
jgi:hypothetical protein